MIGVIQKFELENFLLTDYPVISNFAATLFAIFDSTIIWILTNSENNEL